jgi:ankyrin repeat protein
MIRLKHLSGCVMVPLLLLAGLNTASAEARLVDAVKEGDRAAVRTLLQQRVDVNIAEADGTTALHWAVERQDVALEDELIRAGANPKAVNRYGVTPLTLACVNGDAASVSLLLKDGADPNAALPNGETVLMTAARTGSADAVNALIAHGADVSAKESGHGQTALMWAASEGNVDAIKALVAHGADVRARENGGWTAMLFAVRAGRSDAVRALLASGVDVNDPVVPPPGGRGRGRGAGAGVAGVAGGAGRRGGGPGGGPSALLVAVANARYELASMLLDKGANATYAGQGWTALHEVVAVRTPGHSSAVPAPKGSGNMDSLEFVKRLVAHGANVNALTTARPTTSGPTSLKLVGATAFFMAGRTCDVPLMRLLVELGADPKLPNEDGTTPLLAAAGVDTASPGEDAGTESDCLEATKLTLQLGNDVNAVDKNGNTAMHGAAFKQYPSVVKLLAENGARIEIWDRKNVSGWTPLRIAAGVHRGMNFRFSEPTAAALREVMTAAGVSTELEPEAVISGATPTK